MSELPEPRRTDIEIRCPYCRKLFTDITAYNEHKAKEKRE